MPPKFEASNFVFTDGEPIPEHVEGHPKAEERDPTMLWLEGGTSSEDYYPLAIDIPDYALACLLQRARLRRLEAERSAAFNGGQVADGIQDDAHIRIV